MNSDRRSPFGSRLREFREAAALSQMELAERAGLSLRGISDLERGLRTKPRLETVRMLADGLALDDAGRRELIRARNAGDESGSHAEKRQARSSLPPLTTSFIGRDNEIGQVTSFLMKGEIRLLTLTGPGGVGKTRLAQEVARRLEDQFEDGVVFVDLASIRKPELVLNAVADQLGVHEQADGELEEPLAVALENQELLLVLDNFEHVIETAAHIGRLLVACPGITALTTSRVILHVAAEHVMEINPLPLPESRDVPDLLKLDSISLFFARARAADAKFVLDADNAPAVVEIVKKLQGMPLAIELAAARIRMWPISELIQLLDEQLFVLAGGLSDVPQRHRTMRDTIAWSYELLSQDEKAVFRAISIFPVGCTLDIAVAVFDIDDRMPKLQVTDAVSALVDSSLVRAHKGEDGAVRYRMLFVIREFAYEMLKSAGEEHPIRKAALHAWCLPLAIKMDVALSQPDVKVWLDRATAEYENVQGQIAWLLQEDLVEETLEIVSSFAAFESIRGRSSDVSQTLASLLGHPRNQKKTRTRMKGLVRLGHALSQHSATVTNLEAFQEAETIARILNDERYLVRSLDGIGWELASNGRFEDAGQYLQKVMDVAASSGSPGLIAGAMMSFAVHADSRGRHVQAAEMFEEALENFESAGEIWSVAVVKASWGFTMQRLGDLDRAEELALDARRMYIELGVKSGFPKLLLDLGAIRVQRNDPVGARDLFLEALEISREIGFIFEMGIALNCLAWVSSVEGNFREAQVLCHGAMDAFIRGGILTGAIDCLDIYADLSIGMEEYPRAAWCIGAVDGTAARNGNVRLEFPPGEHQQRLDRLKPFLTPAEWNEHYDLGFSMDEKQILSQVKEWRPTQSTSQILDVGK